MLSFTELFEIELFDHLTVCKQMTDILIELSLIKQYLKT